MTKLIFVRHGESEYNRIKRFTGQKDIPLTSLGEKQAERTCAFVMKNYKIDALYSSDLSRAIQTIQPIADALGLPIDTDSRLREIHLGRWTDAYIDDVKNRERSAYLAYREGAPAPEGESFAQMQARVLQAATEIAKANDGKTVAVASHGGAIRALLAKLQNTGIGGVATISNGSVSEVFFEHGVWTLGKLSQDAHMQEFYSAQDAFTN
jgi:broad specificity phosphatase PhoE